MEELEQVLNTNEWDLYEKALMFASLFNFKTDSDLNYRMYNGDQWNGLKVEGIEKIQLNFIKPVVDYKVCAINQNLWEIIYNAENYEEKEFRPVAEQVCELLNTRARKIWERTKMDDLIRDESMDSAINDEGINYTWWDDKAKLINNEILNKVDVYYGDENSSDIQSQPYILIRKRVPVITAKELAREQGVSEEKIQLITGDTDYVQSVGENSNYEKESSCTIITKMWKDGGKVYYTKATKKVQLMKRTNSGLTRYPLAHFLWSDKKGFSRGEGVVRNLIPNQIEVNRTLMRRAVVTKNTAYPQKVVKIDNIVNPGDVQRVGSTIKVSGQTDDVRNVFLSTTPAQMSADVSALQNDLIELTRTLENAGDITTGAVNPEDASGKAILAVQNASKQNLTNQVQRLKGFIEEIGLIWLDMIVTYVDKKGIILQQEDSDPRTGKTILTNIKVPKSALDSLKASVKIDITPKSPYDRYAQELTLENILKQGWFAPDKIDQLEVYVDSLPDDAVAPKARLKKIIQRQKQKQLYIAQSQAQTQLMFQNAQQYINSDPEVQQDITQQYQAQQSQQTNEVV